MTAPAEDPRGGEACGRSFRSGSGRYYDCGRTTGHDGGHAICDPAPPPVRDAIDAEASRLWAEQHDDHSGPFWQASCRACTAIPAEAFRLGYRAARPAGDRAQPTQELREAVARWLFRKVTRRDGLIKLAFEHLDPPQVVGWSEWADDLLALPELAALLDAQTAVGRVRAALRASLTESGLVAPVHIATGKVYDALDGT